MSTHLIRFSLASILCAAFAASVIAEPPVTGVHWRLDLDEARAIAEREQKLLLIHFTAPWCAPCAALDATVYNQPSVAQVVHAGYVPVKLNTDEFPATRERFGIVRVPTDVIITPDGQVLDKFTPPNTPMAYVSKVGQIAQGYAHQSQRDFQKSPLSASATEPINSAYANLTMPVQSQNPLVDPRTATPGDIARNPLAQGEVQAPMGQGLLGQFPATAVTTPQEQVAASPPVQPTITENQYVTPPAAATAPNQVATTDTTPQPAGAIEPDVIQLPPGAPALGFYGYCPVTMRQEFKWEKGQVEWGAIHRGRTYLFTNQERRDEFLRDPDSYAPVLAGVDPVLAIAQQKVEPGLREYSLEYNGQFYLFANEKTLEEFRARPEIYATGVRQAMGLTRDQRIVR